MQGAPNTYTPALSLPSQLIHPLAYLRWLALPALLEERAICLRYRRNKDRILICCGDSEKVGGELPETLEENSVSAPG
jgi:hypothetical protein